MYNSFFDSFTFGDDAVNASVLRLPIVSGVRGSTLSVPVTMDARGDEVAFMFSLHYQPTQLTNPRVSLGSDVGGFTLTENLNNAGSGRIVVLLDGAPENPLPAGSRHVATITFDIPANAPAGPGGLNFASTPARLSTSDGYGNPLPTRYQNGHAIILADASDSPANYPVQPLHLTPAGYEGSYTGTTPIQPPVGGGGNSGGGNPPDFGGGPTTDPLTPGDPAAAQPATIFGFSPVVVIGAAVALYFLSSSK